MNSQDRRDSVAVYIGLGGNLGDPLKMMQAAIDDLKALPATTFDRCSSFYLSAPVGFVDQPDFINAVCRVYTRLQAEALMQQLLDIERRHDRQRLGPQGGPRTLDLDLLLYGVATINSRHLTVPHPRLHERAFVLYPLSELDPRVIIPGHADLDTLLRTCAGQQIERLTDKRINEQK